jgi:hypothetical protein
MLKKLVLIALVASPLVMANAGTEMIDNTVQAPTYNYAPPPQPVYYLPPPPPVVVYPAFGYYRPVRVFGGYHHAYVRRGYRGGHHWR